MTGLIPLLGSAGLGLVWGWLLVLLYGRGQPTRPLWTFVLPTAATAVVTLVVLWLTSQQAVMLFLGSTSLGALAHKGWLEDLRRHAGPP